jgi:hypothetical protein
MLGNLDFLTGKEKEKETTKKGNSNAWEDRRDVSHSLGVRQKGQMRNRIAESGNWFKAEPEVRQVTFASTGSEYL